MKDLALCLQGGALYLHEKEKINAENW